MIKYATVVNHRSESLKLEMGATNGTGFSIRSIDGLTPVKANVNKSKVSTVAGERITSATVGGRNIVFKLGLHNEPTVEEARLQSYRYFPVGKVVSIFIESDTRYGWIRGVVESNEPEIFTQDPFTTISIVCEDAYLTDASASGKVTTLFYSVEKAFEFPFSNESLTEDRLEFGRLNSISTRSIYYNGDVETGVTITVSALGDVGDFVIYEPDTNAYMRFDEAKLKQLTGTTGLTSGDVLTITTIVGKKSATLVRNGISINALNALDRGSSWLTLDQGENVFTYSASYGASSLQISMASPILFEGI